jgi:Xaa-Pro aminopeptidase
VAPPEYIEPLGLFTNPARRQLSAKLQAANKHVELVDITKQLARLRSIKQPPELRALQAAIDLTTTSLDTIFKAARGGQYTYEYEIEADLDRDFRRGGRGQAFAPIVAGGKRACVLHNIANEGQLAKDQLLLCDVGADYEHYAADISRTISLGAPTSRQKEVHAAVIAAQDFALNLLRPGVILKDYEREVENCVGQQLKQLGLIGSISRKHIRSYMPHAVSHFLGLNAHDIGLYDQPLETGMVITVEPGIYIPNEAIGIRIEDDICITKQGNQVLSQTLSRDLI